FAFGDQFAAVTVELYGPVENVPERVITRVRMKIVLAAVFYHLYHDFHEIAVAKEHRLLHALKLRRLVFEDFRLLGHCPPRLYWILSVIGPFPKVIPFDVTGSNDFLVG